MKTQKLPFLYTLECQGDDGQDYLMKRIREPDPSKYAPDYWGMHMDIKDPRPECVLIFVHATTDPERIMYEINRVQTYFREQIEPMNSNED